MIHSQGEQLEQIIANVVDECTAAMRRGDAVDVEAVALRFPQHAAKIRDTLETLLALETLDQESLHARHEQDETGQPLQSIGDFQLIREIGRGGMGVVYEAQQLSIDRRVAVKVLPFAALADKQRLQRFKNEIRAAGALHHPHIVPVFSVGVERGVHYFAMQFIDGPSLDEVLAQCRAAAPATVKLSVTNDDETQLHEPGSSQVLPAHAKQSPQSETVSEIQAAISTKRSLSPAKFHRTVAEWGVQAASALSYAHQNGILHRDVKPGNLLLDENGQVWVADFGLARIEQDASLTMTGDILGTLRYLAPEQALAKRVLIDHRADIYSLGASLYELFTLRPVFDAEDREELLKKIVFESPTAPRQLEPNISRDLETIILKAIAKDPSDRYDSAEEFAEDLQRYLNREPIRARRASPAARVAKWAGRHSGLVAASLIVATLATVGFAAASYQIAQQRNAANRSAQHADENFQLAQHNFEMANEAVDQLITRVSEEKLLHAPQMEELRKELLADALAFYQRLLETAGESPEAQLQTALAEGHLADILLQLGRRQEALESSAKAVKRLKELTRDHCEEVECAIALSKRLDSHGRILWLTSMDLIADVDAKLIWEAYDEAIKSLRALAIRVPNNHEVAYALAQALYNHAHAAHRFDPDDYGELAARLEEALSIVDSIPKNALPVQDVKLLRARGLTELANNLNELEQDEKGRRLTDEAVALMEELYEQHPGDREVRAELANVCSLRSSMFERSKEDLEQAYNLTRGLAVDFPSIPTYQISAARDAANLGEYASTQGDWPTAETRLRESLSILYDLIQEFPDFNDYVSLLDNTFNGLVGTLIAREDHAGLEELFAKQVELAEQLDRPRMSAYAGKHLCQYAILLVNEGRLEEAILKAEQGYELFQQSVDNVAQYAASDLWATAFSTDMFYKFEALGRRFYECGYQDEASLFIDRTISADLRAQEFILNEDFADPDYFTEPAWLLVAWPDSELRNADQSLELVARAHQLGGTQLEMGYAWTVRGTAHYRSQQWQECIDAMEEAIKGREGTEWPATGFEWFPMAVAYHHLGKSDEAQRWYDQAFAWYEWNYPTDGDRQKKAIEAEGLYEEAKRVFGGTGIAGEGFDQKQLEVAKESDNPWLWQSSGWYSLNRAQELIAEGSVSEAVELADEGYELLQQVQRHPIQDQQKFEQMLEETADACEQLARRLYELGRQEKARAYAERTIAAYEQRHPSALSYGSWDDYYAWSHPAWLLAAWPDPQVRDLDRAVEYAEKAERLDPDHGYCWMARGVAYYRKQEWTKCIEAAHRSIDLRENPEWPATGLEWFPIAAAHLHLGNEEEARKWSEKAIAWYEEDDPNNNDRQIKALEAEALYNEVRQLFEASEVRTDN